MSGGLLQLVAKGREDNIISDDPQITLFQTIYRRHVNFAKAQETLRFNTDLTFGKTGSCVIRKDADYVNHLTLLVKLPSIKIEYVPLTNQQLAIMLAEYGIPWTFTPDVASDVITYEQFLQVVGELEYIDGIRTRLTNGMINDQVDNLTRQLQKDDLFVQIINTVTQQYISAGNTNTDDYIDDLMLELLHANRNLFIADTEYIDNYDYYNQYLYLHNYKKDLAQLTPRGVVWLNTPRNIISFYDPTNNLPVSPSGDDRYISASNSREWITNMIYKYVNSRWNLITPNTYDAVIVDDGFANISADMFTDMTGLQKTCNGFFTDLLSLPTNPEINDTYIYIGSGGTANFIYRWDGISWITIEPSTGNSFYVIGNGINQPSYYRKFVYYSGSAWVIYVLETKLMYDTDQWRKSINEVYDPSTGLPTVITPDSLGKNYLSSSSANGWRINYLYVWDGWEWLERAPVQYTSIYIESGTGSILQYDGFDWKTVSIPLPLFNYEAFRQQVYYNLRDILFTDPNVKLLYGVDNLNTIVIPTSSTLPIRTFFDNGITNEIEAIDTNSAYYKQVYNTFFDTSFTGNQEHVISVQTALSSAMKNCVENEISMQTTLYNRLQYVTSSIPQYYQLIYYQKYSFTDPTYAYDGDVVNVPRSMYTLSSSQKLWDFFGGYIYNAQVTLPVPDYVTYVKSQLLTLIGQQGGDNGALYAITQETATKSMVQNFFCQTTSPYETVLADILVGTYTTNKKIYNLAKCTSVLSTNIKTNLYNDLIHMWDGLEAVTTPTKATHWHGILGTPTTNIRDAIPAITEEPFANTIICDVAAGLPSLMTNNQRMMVFVFQKYTSRTVVDLSSHPTTLQITKQNPVEYLVLSMTESIKSEIIYQNTIAGANELTTNELVLLLQHVDNLASAYLDTGITTFATFDTNQTNILATTVPELFSPYAPTPITSYHVPYDGVTSLMCYLLNSMKNEFNSFYQNVTDQAIYDSLGNPMMTMNSQFITSDDFYNDGASMYTTSNALVTSLVSAYTGDLVRYNKYGNVLKIKNLFLEPQKYKYTYPIEMYVEMHKAIYNSPSIYINPAVTTYTNLYNDVLTQLNSNMLPLLEFFNVTNGIYMGPMDIIMESLTQRLRDLRVNPYSSIDDTTRYAWYNAKIIPILNTETKFSPEPVGLIEYFVNSIDSVTNPFSPNLTLHDWYDGLDWSKRTYEKTKMSNLFGIPYYYDNALNSNAITPQNLYDNLGNINNDYNGLANMTDYVKYMMDHVIKLSSLGNIVPLFKKTIPATADILTNYYLHDKSNNLELINKINPYTLTVPYKVSGLAPPPIKYSTVEDIIRNVYNKEPVNFAWIKELGHYLLESVEFLIDDAVIDKYSGEYAHIIASLESTASRVMGYAKMIGHVPELYTYNNKPKPEYNMYMPLFFTFGKFTEASLPLLCLQHAEVSIKVKLRELSDVAYWAPLTRFIKEPKLKCSIIADYIFLDHEERMRISPLKHEYLIEQTQYNGDVTVDLSVETDKTVKLSFTGMSKELFLVCQMDEYVNGSLPNGEKQWNNYMVTVPKEYLMSDGSYVTDSQIVNPIDKLEIRFNGRQREALKDALFYTCAQKYQHHNANLNNGVHVYSFSIYPEQLQPSGAANAGKIGYIELYMTFNPDVISLVGKSKKTMRVGVYNKSSNILRIMSGLGGVAFYS